MELKRRVNLEKLFKYIVFGVLAIYLFIGFLPAGAATYSINSELSIQSIGLNTPVTKLELENSKLNTPDDIVGSYSQNDNTTLLIGHSTTIFKNLFSIKRGDLIMYGREPYIVKSLNVKAVENIHMNELLKASSKDTLYLMTCAGRKTKDSFTHRLIVKAEKL